MQNAEPVRLVIWDLDETFWSGTLTEGGITYRRDFHDIVLALARRGIVSSICSKNDHERVREILVREGHLGQLRLSVHQLGVQGAAPGGAGGGRAVARAHGPVHR